MDFFIYSFSQPPIANIICFCFIVEHTDGFFKHNPQTQSPIALDSISHILIGIEVMKKTEPFIGTIKQGSAPKVWSKREGVTSQVWQLVESQVIIARSAMNSKLIIYTF